MFDNDNCQDNSIVCHHCNEKAYPVISNSMDVRIVKDGKMVIYGKYFCPSCEKFSYVFSYTEGE